MVQIIHNLVNGTCETSLSHMDFLIAHMCTCMHSIYTHLLVLITHAWMFVWLL